jgi:hypothetical protein
MPRKKLPPGRDAPRRDSTMWTGLGNELRAGWQAWTAETQGFEQQTTTTTAG